ncbi:hypothetical protein FSP39_002808 [Pinctada imbricata]|uniref:C-type lectin domain-containing protein n=1 Tax=Pinctada imbricata TaxID=66713 RepID=A0AA88YU99_PINIB|nr:hypothetical protein FSP39_002808 [Pinctada imbricata]
MHLSAILASTNCSKLVIGSDEEAALVKAITHAFPNSTHILCSRHIQQNARQRLTDDAVSKSGRDTILDMIFGSDGLVNANDSICFDEKSVEIETKCEDISNKFLSYFQKRLKETIRKKVNEPQIACDLESWTNNNSESINNVLKHLVQWKSKPLMDLINAISTYANAQFKDIRRSIVGVGQFRLSKSHKHFEVSKTVWVSKTDEERSRLYKRCRNFISKDSKTITSTDGQTTVVAPRAHGKNVRFYIGVADYFVEGKWMFISSLKQAAPTYWDSGEPNNDGNEDCVEILPGSGQWADCSCTLQRNFICEKNV